MKKEEVLERFQKDYKAARSGCKNQWKHIESCRNFYNGDYMNYRDELTLGFGSSSRVVEVSFNRIKPYVNSIVGFFAQQRQKPFYQARIPDSEMQAARSDYLNGYSDYTRENCNSDQLETRQDLDLIIGGIGCIDTALTTKVGAATRLPGGEILQERVDMLHVGYDPQARQANLLDACFVYRAKDYDVEVAEELFGKEEDEFEFVSPDSNINDYQFFPGGITDKVGYDWTDYEQRLVRVYFYQWYEVENFYRIENPLYEQENVELLNLLMMAFQSIEQKEEEEIFRFDPRAKILTITKDIKSKVKGIFDALDIPFKPLTEKRKIYYTAVISGNRVFDSYRSVSQDGFSLKFKTGDRDERNNIWTGVVASMRDPQKYYNKSLTELMIIIASNSRGGVMYERSAISDIQNFERNYARTTAAVMVEDGAISGNKIKPKAEPQMPTGYEAILQASSDALSQVTGIDESFFGAVSGGNETAMLQRQRIKQAIVVLAVYMDSIVLFTKEQAKLLLCFMRKLAESNKGQYFNMKGDDGNLIYEEISPDYFVDEYDIIIGEAPDTATQNEYYTQTLITLGQSMQAINDPRYSQIFAEAVKQMPLKERDKSAVIKILTESPTADMEKQQMQTAIEQQQQLIDMMKVQIEDLQMRLTNKQGELALKAKEQSDKNKIEIEKNDLEAMKIAISRKATELDALKIKLDSAFKREQLQQTGGTNA